MIVTLDTNDLMTPSELARQRGVTRKTVYNWLKAGTAPPHEIICGHIFFYRSKATQDQTA